MKMDNGRYRYRNSLDIVKDILTLIDEAENLGLKKTHIMYGANLSYDLLKKYLTKTLQSGFLNKEGSHYTITDKGKKYLQKYKEYETSQEKTLKIQSSLSKTENTLENLLPFHLRHN